MFEFPTLEGKVKKFITLVLACYLSLFLISPLGAETESDSNNEKSPPTESPSENNLLSKYFEALSKGVSSCIENIHENSDSVCVEGILDIMTRVFSLAQDDKDRFNILLELEKRNIINEVIYYLRQVNRVHKFYTFAINKTCNISHDNCQKVLSKILVRMVSEISSKRNILNQKEKLKLFIKKITGEISDKYIKGAKGGKISKKFYGEKNDKEIVAFYHALKQSKIEKFKVFKSKNLSEYNEEDVKYNAKMFSQYKDLVSFGLEKFKYLPQNYEPKQIISDENNIHKNDIQILASTKLVNGEKSFLCKVYRLYSMAQIRMDCTITSKKNVTIVIPASIAIKNFNRMQAYVFDYSSLKSFGELTRDVYSNVYYLETFMVNKNDYINYFNKKWKVFAYGNTEDEIDVKEVKKYIKELDKTIKVEEEVDEELSDFQKFLNKVADVTKPGFKRLLKETTLFATKLFASSITDVLFSFVHEDWQKSVSRIKQSVRIFIRGMLNGILFDVIYHYLGLNIEKEGSYDSDESNSYSDNDNDDDDDDDDDDI